MSEAFMLGLLRKNIPMSLTLHLEESAAAEERQGFFIRWSAGALSSISGRHSRITLGSLSATRILGISMRRAFIIKAWGANLHVVHWVDFVFINATPAKNNWGVGGLLMTVQCLGQRTGVELRDRTPHSHDVDVGEVLRKIRIG